MNEQLQAKLVEILAGIQAATKTAGDFAMEQLPDIAQQYVLYGRVAAILQVCFWLAVLIAAAYSLRRLLSNGRAEDESSTAAWEVLCVPVGFVAVASAVALMLSAKSAALVWIAPKVWLLKELASLIK